VSIQYTIMSLSVVAASGIRKKLLLNKGARENKAMDTTRLYASFVRNDA